MIEWRKDNDHWKGKNLSSPIYRIWIIREFKISFKKNLSSILFFSKYVGIDKQ